MNRAANFVGYESLAYEQGAEDERERIIELLELEASEWLSHHGTCDCKVRGEEVLRLIEKIKESSDETSI